MDSDYGTAASETKEENLWRSLPGRRQTFSHKLDWPQSYPTQKSASFLVLVCTDNNGGSDEEQARCIWQRSSNGMFI